MTPETELFFEVFAVQVMRQVTKLGTLGLRVQVTVEDSTLRIQIPAYGMHDHPQDAVVAAISEPWKFNALFDLLVTAQSALEERDRRRNLVLAALEAMSLDELHAFNAEPDLKYLIDISIYQKKHSTKE